MQDNFDFQRIFTSSLRNDEREGGKIDLGKNIFKHFLHQLITEIK